MYRGSANAFNALDFTGRGYITEEDLGNKYLLLRANVTIDELRLASRLFNFFVNKANKKLDAPLESMTYDMFKKSFFPQYCYVDEDTWSEGEKQA